MCRNKKYKSVFRYAVLGISLTFIGLLLIPIGILVVIIHFHDIEPIYLQLIKKIECAILSTQLSAGEELPSIRVMAKMLKISPNTVMKAYMRLCQSGLIVSSRNGHYSVIDNEQYILQARDEKVRELCISYLSNMMSLGFSKEEATDFLTEYSSKLKEPNKCNH